MAVSIPLKEIKFEKNENEQRTRIYPLKLQILPPKSRSLTLNFSALFDF